MDYKDKEYKDFRANKVKKGLEEVQSGQTASPEEVFRAVIEAALKADKESRLVA